MRVNVLFFGVLRDIVGRSSEEIELPPGAPAGGVFDHYAALFPRLRELDSSVMVARNQEFCRRAAALEDGDEVALLPPVSGGASPYTRAIQNEAGFFALTREPIDAAALSALVARSSDGAVVAFSGITRDNSGGRPTRYLEYDCYEPMAVKTMAALGAEIAAAHAIGRIVMVHRLGRLEIGETSVLILAAAPHRAAAFEAARAAIDRLKRTVPIWKKEYFADGEVWVEGEWDTTVTRS